MPMALLRASNADSTDGFGDRFGETVALSCDGSIVGGEPALKHDTTIRGRRLGSIGGNLGVDRAAGGSGVSDCLAGEAGSVRCHKPNQPIHRCATLMQAGTNARWICAKR
jgi:hypothetical protein